MLNKNYLIFGIILLLSFVSVSAVLTDGLVSYYNFNNNTNDSLGIYNFTTGVGSTQYNYISGIIGTATGPINASNYFNSTYNPNFGYETNISFSMWIRYNTTIPTSADLITSTVGGGSCVIALSISSSKYSFGIWKNGQSPQYASSSFSPATNNWTHLVGVYNGSSKVMQLYVNGVLQNSTTNTQGTCTTLSKLYFGEGKVIDVRGAVNANYDELAIYNRSITSDEVQLLYNGGNGLAYPLSYRASGGVITTSGSYTIHTFTGNGTFTVTNSFLTAVEVLVVAGGGGGDSLTSLDAAGAGAGGVIYNASNLVSVTAYPVVVGLGGLNLSANSNASNGGNSSFNGLIAVGGGYGAISGLSGAGGSSGGTQDYGRGGRVANNTPGQGWFGSYGISDLATYTNYGGGGGCGGNAVNATSLLGGMGGPGCNYSISGSTVCYAGGGAGHAAAGGGRTSGTATCGGGNGSTTYDAVNGTGGGGGTNGKGGSGIVIIRYLTNATSYTLKGRVQNVSNTTYTNISGAYIQITELATNTTWMTTTNSTGQFIKTDLVNSGIYRWCAWLPWSLPSVNTTINNWCVEKNVSVSN